MHLAFTSPPSRVGLVVLSLGTLALAVLAVFRDTGITPKLGRTLPRHAALFAFAPMATKASEVAEQVRVLRASEPAVVAPPGAVINIGANFDAGQALPEDDVLMIFLVDGHGTEVARITNDLNGYATILPTSRWVGPITIVSSMTIPNLGNGLYSIMLGLYRITGPVQLSPGSGVAQDAHFRYKIGTLKVEASASVPSLLPASTLDLTGYHLTFDEPFTELSISDSTTNDGSRWYARNEECCLNPTDGATAAMAGISDARNPFSLVPGGGLNIRLQRVANSWTTGVLTSVDSLGSGFSQQYGYFEMKARFPAGQSTWPAFWLLNTAAKKSGAKAGEVDIVEYISNPGPPNIGATLHDWANGTAPAASHNLVPSPTAGFHTYGMLWTAATTTFYFDRTVILRGPTPPVMKQPYYFLIDLGMGGGWPTDKTPSVNDMQIQYIRAYSK